MEAPVHDPLWIPPDGPSAPPALHAPNLLPLPPPYEQFSVHNPNGGKRKILQTASEHMQKAGPNLWAWRRMPL